MPIDPKSIQWDGPADIQWDDAPKDRPSNLERFARGVKDPIDGGAQLLTKILPAGVVKAGNSLNNWIADKTGLVARLPEGGVDQMVRDEEAAYQARRGPNAGLDLVRLGGNILSPANAAIASRLPVAGSLASRAGMGALGGGASALLQPVTSGDDFAAEKLKQVATGAVFGGAVPVIGAGMQRMVSPQASTNPAVQTLRDANVRTTIGQTLGGTANRLEEKAMSVPILGDVIRSARDRGTADLNAAVANRALQPLGESLPSGMVGREAVAHVKQTLSDAYEKLLPRMTVKADATFGQELGQLRSMVKTGSMDPKAAALFDRILQNDVLSKFRGQGALTGKTIKNIESDLSAQISRLGQSTDSDSRLVGDALKEVQSALRGVASRSNPQLADELSKINAGYAVFKRMERAAASVGSEEGAFTAAQLQNAVKALDKSKDKGRFARGEALLQDLSDSAKSVLGQKVPNSGTADRMLGTAGLGGAAFLDPVTTGASVGIGSLLYSPMGQQALRTLVAARPAAAQKVGGLLAQASPVLSPAGGLLALEVAK